MVLDQELVRYILDWYISNRNLPSDINTKKTVE